MKKGLCLLLSQMCIRDRIQDDLVTEFFGYILKPDFCHVYLLSPVCGTLFVLRA